MNLLRYGPPGEEKPGILDGDGKIRDLSGIIPDLAGESFLPESMEKLRNNDISLLPKVAGQPRIGPCVGSVGKFVCIGFYYFDPSGGSRDGRACGTSYLHEGDVVDLRSKRQRGRSARIQEDGLGGRTWRRHWQAG